jgi:glycosyltransferase involved in cell wall biosynthesis/SAM-dependent methyltransferase
MKFTGERYVPMMDEPEAVFEHRQLACEHWHRYLYASQFVAGKTVLDVASGEGYGSYCLAGVAKQVVGVEPDPEAVRRASNRYVKPNLEFRRGSAEVIPVDGKHVFDAVVCFETIEHVWEGQQLTFLGEIERLLKPEGVFLVSTPNKLLYSDRPGHKNEFHRREFYYQDYLSLLRKYFRTVHVLGQNAYPISYIWHPAGLPQPLSEYQLAYSDGQLGPSTGDKKELLYMLAICSNGEIGVPGGSVLLDVAGEVFRPAVEEAGENETSLADLRQALEEHVREEAVRRQAADVQQQVQELARQNEAGQRELAELQRHAQTLAEENTAYQRQIADLQRAVAEQQERADTLAAQVKLGSGREKELQEMLLEAHDQLLRRDEEIQAALAEALPQNAPAVTGAVAVNGGSLPGKHLPYRLLLHRIGEVVRTTLPPEATVLMISKGDGELLKLPRRPGWHFPQNEEGVWAGYNPADSAAAIKHLEEVRGKGADFLLIPATSLWWLDHYQEFHRHLEGRYRLVVRQDDVCAIYALREGPGPKERPGESAQEARTSSQRPFGMNVVGNMASERGTGEAVRATVRSLEAANVPYVLNNFVDDYSANEDRAFSHFSDDNPYAINLLQVNADMVPVFVRHKGEAYLRGRYNVGYWFWELSEFPEEQWQSSFRHLDEVWVGSSFVLDAVSRVAPVPVVRIPLSVPDKLVTKNLRRSDFGLPRDTFVFLFMFDYMSITERKNPLGLIKAFKKAFRRKDKALLVLKCSNSSPASIQAVGDSPAIPRAIQDAAAGANVLILDSVLGREEVNTLLSLADCYVSLHRSEGFGLPLAEAMSLAKPVIATGYSGNVDFMTPANSFLVRYDLIELERDYGPYKKGCTWADPDLDHAAELMRFVYERRKAAKEVGRKAREYVRRTLHPQVVGRQIKERLLQIGALGKVAALGGRNGQPVTPPTRDEGRAAREQLR